MVGDHVEEVHGLEEAGGYLWFAGADAAYDVGTKAFFLGEDVHDDGGFGVFYGAEDDASGFYEHGWWLSSVVNGIFTLEFFYYSILLSKCFLL